MDRSFLQRKCVLSGSRSTTNQQTAADLVEMDGAYPGTPMQGNYLVPSPRWAECSLAGRWRVGSPEPGAIPVVGRKGEQFQILDFTRLTLPSRIDIYPGQSELL